MNVIYVKKFNKIVHHNYVFTISSNPLLLVSLRFAVQHHNTHLSVCLVIPWILEGETLLSGLVKPWNYPFLLPLSFSVQYTTTKKKLNSAINGPLLSSDIEESSHSLQLIWFSSNINGSGPSFPLKDDSSKQQTKSPFLVPLNSAANQGSQYEPCFYWFCIKFRITLFPVLDFCRKQ